MPRCVGAGFKPALPRRPIPLLGGVPRSGGVVPGATRRVGAWTRYGGYGGLVTGVLRLASRACESLDGGCWGFAACEPRLRGAAPKYPAAF
ncbi:MAG: hypothetical protein LBM98_09850 [Oscillospiraceae bacterium]|nr:hypothetical protein [Oscillospiraceae bacterium]